MGVAAPPVGRWYLYNLLRGPRSPPGQLDLWHFWNTRHVGTLCLYITHVALTTAQTWVQSYGLIKAKSLGLNCTVCAEMGPGCSWSTCRSQPAELGSSSWPARGSDRSAGWGSVKSSVSAGYFLWPLTTPPDLPPDSHLDGNVREGQQKKTDRQRQSRGSNSPVIQTALQPFITNCSSSVRIYALSEQIGAALYSPQRKRLNNFTFPAQIKLLLRLLSGNENCDFTCWS